MSRRTLTDEQWWRIEGYLPSRIGTPGRSGVDNRLFVDAILWMAGNAARWRDLPEVFGKWTAVHARFRRWSHAGVWERLFHALADTPDFEYVLIDSTISKVHADATGAKRMARPVCKQIRRSDQSSLRQRIRSQGRTLAKMEIRASRAS